VEVGRREAGHASAPREGHGSDGAGGMLQLPSRQATSSRQPERGGSIPRHTDRRDARPWPALPSFPAFLDLMQDGTRPAHPRASLARKVARPPTMLLEQDVARLPTPARARRDVCHHPPLSPYAPAPARSPRKVSAPHITTHIPNTSWSADALGFPWYRSPPS
jgi:hypothetical protein